MQHNGKSIYKSTSKMGWGRILEVFRCTSHIPYCCDASIHWKSQPKYYCTQPATLQLQDKLQIKIYETNWWCLLGLLNLTSYCDKGVGQGWLMAKNGSLIELSMIICQFFGTDIKQNVIPIAKIWIFGLSALPSSSPWLLHAKNTAATLGDEASER